MARSVWRVWIFHPVLRLKYEVSGKHFKIVVGRFAFCIPAKKRLISGQQHKMTACGLRRHTVQAMYGSTVLF